MPGGLVVAAFATVDLGGLECNLGFKLFFLAFRTTWLFPYVLCGSLTLCSFQLALLTRLLYTSIVNSQWCDRIDTHVTRVTRDSHVPCARTKSWSSPFGSHPVAVTPILRLPSPVGRLPTLSTSQTVAPTDSSSSPNNSSGLATLATPNPCSTLSVASTESKRQSRTAVVVRSFSFSFPASPLLDILTPTPGSVYLGTHTVAGKEVAIKLQPTVPRNSPIRQESKIYKTLSGSPGIPWIMWSGKQGDFDVMILDLLGPSLEDLFKMRNKHFSLKTVLLIADQLVSISPYFHSLDVTRARFPFWAALTLLPSLLPAGAYRIHPLPRFGPQRRQTRKFCHGCRQIVLSDQRD